MPFGKAELNKVLKDVLPSCSITKGMVPSQLGMCLESQLLAVDGAQEVKITLENLQELRFIIQTENNKTVLTSLDCLASDCHDGVDVELLPEIIAKLDALNLQATAIQFPHAFMVKGRFTGIAYRAHFNHLVIYKDNTNSIHASVIDSTFNPFGVFNPVPVLNWLASNSILSGKELIQVKLVRLLGKNEVKNTLQRVFNGDKDTKVSVTDTITTNAQPSMGDKRCGIYTFSSIATLISYVTSQTPLTLDGIKKEVTEAHLSLNEQEMMDISRKTDPWISYS